MIKTHFTKRDLTYLKHILEDRDTRRILELYSMLGYNTRIGGVLSELLAKRVGKIFISSDPLDVDLLVSITKYRR